MEGRVSRLKCANKGRISCPFIKIILIDDVRGIDLSKVTELVGSKGDFTTHYVQMGSLIPSRFIQAAAYSYADQTISSSAMPSEPLRIT